MPYKVSKSGSGYKVKNKNSGKTYSKKPMSKEKAKKQMAAIYANTNESLLRRIDATLESYEGLPDEDEFGMCPECGSPAEEAQICRMCGSTMLNNYPPDGITVCSDCGATEDTTYAIVCVNCLHTEPIAESYEGLPDEDQFSDHDDEGYCGTCGEMGTWCDVADGCEGYWCKCNGGPQFINWGHGEVKAPGQGEIKQCTRCQSWYCEGCASTTKPNQCKVCDTRPVSGR
jgi:hypothetical protein